MTRRRLLRAVPVALVAVVLLLVPQYGTTFQVTLVTQGLVWATLALSVWLLLRRMALPSFGHAAFFGVAAYTAGLAASRWGVDNVFVALVLAIGVTCAVALPIALVAGRLQGVSFLLITLAFAEMLRSLAQRWDELGGSDGLVGVLRPSADPLPLELALPADYFYFVLAVLAVCALVLLVVVRSPFGGVLVGIRESPERMAALGYNPVAYRIGAFMLSAAIAGAAGAMQAYLTRFVSPDDLGALISAQALLTVVIGGVSMLGAAVVAIGLTILEEVLSTTTERWVGVLGVIYVLVALLTLEPGRARALWSRVAAAVPRMRRGGGRDPILPLVEKEPL